MSFKYKVVQGDCIDSISSNFGFMPDTIWNHPANAELKQKRQNPNILFPGDVVVVPDKTLREEPGTTEERHRFRRRSVPAFFHLQLLENDQPRAGVEYVFEVDGLNVKGVTDDQGRLKERIPPNAKRGKLYVKAGQDWEEYGLAFGHLDPVDEIKGIQERLQNLGFYTGIVNGEMDNDTREAIESYQRQRGMQVTGRIEDIRERLVSEHDSAVVNPTRTTSDSEWEVSEEIEMGGEWPDEVGFFGEDVVEEEEELEDQGGKALETGPDEIDEEEE